MFHLLNFSINHLIAENSNRLGFSMVSCQCYNNSNKDITSYLFTEKIQHDKMQVFSRKVWKDEKVREGGDTQTDVDEYFISQKVHTHISTQPMSSRYPLPINKLFDVRIRGRFDRQSLLFDIFFSFPTGHF